MESNYQERYRNQFHFSPREGWMNDINGLWYADGLYHMTYQARPLRERAIGQAYAVSPDLLHWRERGPVLVPGRDCVGEAYSGTAVVDAHNRAGFGAGAYLLFYTDTERGQCLAYSTDRGAGFSDYAGNPLVAITAAERAGGQSFASQRDPKVFWHPDTRRWVMLLSHDWEDPEGQPVRVMRIFTSEDLLHWKQGEDFVHPQFFECPDAFPLPLDGDPQNVKWVFSCASTHYVIGRFDGERLVVEEDPQERFCQGPDAYAGQSLFDPVRERTVAILWMNCWTGSTVPTEPWENSATFPTELALKTFPEGMRVVRSPLPELESLYTKGGWEQAEGVADARSNPLEGRYAKAFDLAMTLDVGETRAEEIVFRIMGRSFWYRVSSGELYTYAAIKKDRQRARRWSIVRRQPEQPLRLRFLVDADSIELFVDDGRYSYTEEYGFSGADERLSVNAGQPVRLRDIRFHPIGSIWDEA